MDYLKINGITTVAMESTGVYWLPLYIMLEEAGIEPYLVNAKHVKNVTGRKRDDTDAIWLQKLHTCGLLQKSFQPDNEIRVLRNYTRQRKNLISLSSDAVRRMQKHLNK
ncbi:MAG: transposase [Saprospiraceae bacterium]|nr:transposase [Saprospiraceae bacterium]